MLFVQLINTGKGEYWELSAAERLTAAIAFLLHNSKYFFVESVNRRRTGEKSDTGVYLKVSGMEQVQRMTYSAWEKLPLSENF